MCMEREIRVQGHSLLLIIDYHEQFSEIQSILTKNKGVMIGSVYNILIFMITTLNNFPEWNTEMDLILKLENNEPQVNHVL